jgi:hypothetical protein
MSDDQAKAAFEEWWRNIYNVSGALNNLDKNLAMATWMAAIASTPSPLNENPRPIILTNRGRSSG